MKPPRPKIHLLDVDEPLLSYHGLACRCGIELRNAQPKFMLADDPGDYLFLALGSCMDCMDLCPVGESQRRYVYGLVEAQEEKDSAA